MNNDEKNIHPVRRFIDKRTENTLKPWFHEKNNTFNNSSEGKNALIKIFKILVFYSIIAFLIHFFI